MIRWPAATPASVARTLVWAHSEARESRVRAARVAVARRKTRAATEALGWALDKIRDRELRGG